MGVTGMVMGGMDYMAGQSAGVGFGSGEGLLKVSGLGNIHDFITNQNMTWMASMTWHGIDGAMEYFALSNCLVFG